MPPPGPRSHASSRAKPHIASTNQPTPATHGDAGCGAADSDTPDGGRAVDELTEAAEDTAMDGEEAEAVEARVVGGRLGDVTVEVGDGTEVSKGAEVGTGVEVRSGVEVGKGEEEGKGEEVGTGEEGGAADEDAEAGDVCRTEVSDEERGDEEAAGEDTAEVTAEDGKDDDIADEEATEEDQGAGDADDDLSDDDRETTLTGRALDDDDALRLHPTATVYCICRLNSNSPNGSIALVTVAGNAPVLV